MVPPTVEKRVKGDVGVVGVGEAIEVGPQQRQTFAGDDLDAFVNGALGYFGNMRW